MNPSSLGHIGVLMGGYSSEREISLKSGWAIYKALKEAGCRVTAVDIRFKEEDKIFSLIQEVAMDVAFIALHGCLGEDGMIQSILQKANILYAGSGVEASQRALNKIEAQTMLKRKNIPVADYWVAHNGHQANRQQLIPRLNLPVVVKPASEGSSIGVTPVFEKKNLDPALDKAFQYGPLVLVERYIKGKELTVGILGNEALPPIEICPKNPDRFFDFESKYQPGRSEHIVPARIPTEISQRVQRIALRAHGALGCEDFSRVDIMIDEDNNPYVLEVNTIPGFTPMSLLPEAARAIGFDFTQLCLRLVGMAYDKKKK